MQPMKHAGLIVGLLAGIVLGSRSSVAQYTADFQTNIISGVASNWSGNYIIGSNTFGDVLLIQNSGLLSNRWAYVGYEFGSSNNSVLISGTGSVWSNAGLLAVGYSGAGNTLVISNGGQVFNRASYVGSNDSSGSNSVVVTGPGSVWYSKGLWLGYKGQGNSLVIHNGGKLVANEPSYLGGMHYISWDASGNSVMIADTGSVWTNNGGLAIGGGGGGNTLMISNGGQLVTFPGGDFNDQLGVQGGNNRVVITGSGSVWNSQVPGLLSIGYTDDNELEIVNGGKLTSGFCPIGAGRGNRVVVSGVGSVWSNSSLYIGQGGGGNTVVISNGAQMVSSVVYVSYSGSSNSLVVAGGSVFATNLVVGFASVTCDNLIQLDSGSVIVTNATADAVFEVRQGKYEQNGGLLQVDRFIMTNACAQFVRTGGTLIYGTAVLDPVRDDDGDGLSNGYEQSNGLDPLEADADLDEDGDGMSNLQEYQAGTDPTNSASAFRITSLVETDNDVLITWTTGSGKTNALQATAGEGSYTNDFADLFIVTNTVGTVTNYLDGGAATNFPARYYRVRLVP